MKGTGIFAPADLVEIYGKEEAGLVLQQRIDACDKRLTISIVARQVPANDVVSHSNRRG